MLDMNNTQQSDDEELSVRQEFLKLCDEFSEFNEYCAFFCGSVSLHVCQREQMDKVCAQGIKRFAQSVRDKSQDFENRLQKLNTMM